MKLTKIRALMISLLLFRNIEIKWVPLSMESKKAPNKGFTKMPPKSQRSKPTQGGTFVKPNV
jgi:hypothetical protein